MGTRKPSTSDTAWRTVPRASVVDPSAVVVGGSDPTLPWQNGLPTRCSWTRTNMLMFLRTVAVYVFLNDAYMTCLSGLPSWCKSIAIAVSRSNEYRLRVLSHRSFTWVYLMLSCSCLCCTCLLMIHDDYYILYTHVYVLYHCCTFIPSCLHVHLLKVKYAKYLQLRINCLEALIISNSATYEPMHNRVCRISLVE